MLEFIQTFAIRIAVIVVLFAFLIQIVKVIGRIWESCVVRAFVSFMRRGSEHFAHMHPLCAVIVRSIARAGELSEIAFRGFHSIGWQDSLEHAGVKVRENFLRGLVYDVADYPLAIVCLTLVSQLNDLHWSFMGIFLAVWAFDMIVFIFAYIGCEKSDQDLSLGKAHRNAYDAVSMSSERAGCVYKMIQHPIAVIWDGPVQLVYFYHREMNAVSKIVITSLMLTCAQGLFWAYIYTIGHNTVIARIVEYFG